MGQIQCTSTEQTRPAYVDKFKSMVNSTHPDIDHRTWTRQYEETKAEWDQMTLQDVANTHKMYEAYQALCQRTEQAYRDLQEELKKADRDLVKISRLRERVRTLEELEEKQLDAICTGASLHPLRDRATLLIKMSRFYWEMTRGQSIGNETNDDRKDSDSEEIVPLFNNDFGDQDLMRVPGNEETESIPYKSKSTTLQDYRFFLLCYCVVLTTALLTKIVTSYVTF